MFERTNVVLDRRGAVLVREMTLTVFRRAPAGERGGLTFGFERFAARRHAGAAPAPAPEREIPLPKAPTFAFDPAAFDLAMIDDVPAPETNAMEFRVLVIDAPTSDILRCEPPGSVRIGQALPVRRPDGPQPIPGGTYTVGTGSLQVAGVTRVAGDACLEVRFVIEGSQVALGAGSVTIDRHEYVRGSLVVSRCDGRVVAGQRWGPVAATFRQDGGTEPPIGSIVQYVTLRELPDGG